MQLSNVEAVRERLDAYVCALHPARGDEQHLHVADLGSCDRETWARRHAFTPPDFLPGFNAETHEKFEMGFDFERHVFEALGDDVATGVRVAIRIDFKGHVIGRVVDESYEPEPDEVVGHPDGVADDTVLELKTTEFRMDKAWKRIIPDEGYLYAHSRHYLLQCGTYALALGREYGLLALKCRTSGKKALVQFNPLVYQDEIVARIRQARRNTHNGTMPWPTLGEWTFSTKGESYLCKFCHFKACTFNRAPESEFA